MYKRQAESNSDIQAAMAREAIEAQGMTAEDFTVSSSNEIQTVVTSMAVSYTHLDVYKRQRLQGSGKRYH